MNTNAQELSFVFKHFKWLKYVVSKHIPSKIESEAQRPFFNKISSLEFLLKNGGHPATMPCREPFKAVSICNHKCNVHMIDKIYIHIATNFIFFVSNGII